MRCIFVLASLASETTSNMSRFTSGGLFYCVLVGVVYKAYSQFPRKCVTSEALDARECCPTWTDQSKCGIKSGRGSCQPINALPLNDIEAIKPVLLDERKLWPTVIFDSACKCIGNYDGIDCGSCKPGYRGDSCDKKYTVIRKNVLQMSSKETSKLISVIDKSKKTNSENYVILTTSYDQILTGVQPDFKNVSIYDLFAWMHYYASRDNLRFQQQEMDALFRNTGKHEQIGRTFLSDNLQPEIIEILKSKPELDIDPDTDYAHEGPAFLPWHRYFLLKWEQEIRDFVAFDDTFAVPYWDWTQSTGCDVCNNQLMGGNRLDSENLLSTQSPFSTWGVVCTAGNDYILNGKQCTGEGEGPLVRNPGTHDPEIISGIPTEEEVEATVRTLQYETSPFDLASNFSFRNVIEGFADPISGLALDGFSTMHNAVHLFMNGTMSEVASSANDPIFILHHAFIDSLYERWLKQVDLKSQLNVLYKNEDNIKIGHRLNDFMVPFFPLVENVEGFASTGELGYFYEYLFLPVNDNEESSADNSREVTQDENDDIQYLTPNDDKENVISIQKDKEDGIMFGQDSTKHHRTQFEHRISMEKKRKSYPLKMTKLNKMSHMHKNQDKPLHSNSEYNDGDNQKNLIVAMYEKILTIIMYYMKASDSQSKIFDNTRSSNSLVQENNSKITQSIQFEEINKSLNIWQKVSKFFKTFTKNYNHLPLYHQLAIGLFGIIWVVIAVIFCCRLKYVKAPQKSSDKKISKQCHKKANPNHCAEETEALIIEKKGYEVI